MRLPLAALAACLFAASAQAGDRFGPLRPTQDAPPIATPSPYDAGRALTWSRKTVATAAPARDIHTLQSAPLAEGLLAKTSASPYPTLRGAQPQPPTQQPAPQQIQPQIAAAPPPAPAPRPQAPQTLTVTRPTVAQPAIVPPQVQTPPQSQTATVAALPTSLFDDTPDPAHQAAAAAAVPPRPVALAGGPPGSTAGPRYYSVHRSYGVEPDPIPMTQTGVGQ